MTDTLEIHIIELPKLLNQLENNPGNKKNKIALWSMFLLNPEKIGEEDMKENKEIKKAKEELEKIRQNEKDIRLAKLRMKYILDQNSMRNSGYREGFSEGLSEGIKQGIAQHQIETAKKLIKLKIPTEQIIEITGLTEDEIKNI